MLEALSSLQQERLERAVHPRATRLEQLWLCPWRIMRTPDPWQRLAVQQAVTRMEPVLMMCSRQVGKTETTAAVSYLGACLGWFVLVVSPSDEQSKEFMARMLEYHTTEGLVPAAEEPTKHELLLRGGGRVLARPNNERTVRVYSKVDLLVIDEAARVPDALYGAVKPMLAVSGGREVLLSTPCGRRGFFYREWVDEGKRGWNRHSVPWNRCPRISPQFVEQERRSHGDLWVKQEYEAHRPSTLVRMADGTTHPVGGLVKGDQVTSLRGPCSVVAVRHVGTKLSHRIETEFGTEFMASADHKVATRVGECKLSEAQELQYVRRLDYSSVPHEVMARLIGYNTGDGNLIRRRSGGYQASWASKYYGDLTKLACDIGVLSTRTPSVRVHSIKGGSAYSYQVNVCSDFAKMMAALGCPVGPKKFQRFLVPDWISAGTAGVKREYLAALFGAEGTTPFRRKESLQCIAPRLSMLKSNKEDGVEFFEGLKAMALALGVATEWVVTGTITGWLFNLRVVGGNANVTNFFEAIGYRYTEAKERLAFLWAKYLKAYAYERVRLGRGGLLKTAQYAGFQVFEDWVKERESGITLFARIVDRRDEDFEDMVNIEVDSKDHSYVLADGLNNYNCQFLSLVNSPFDVEAMMQMERDDYGTF